MEMIWWNQRFMFTNKKEGFFFISNSYRCVIILKESIIVRAVKKEQLYKM